MYSGVMPSLLNQNITRKTRSSRVTHLLSEQQLPMIWPSCSTILNFFHQRVFVPTSLFKIFWRIRYEIFKSRSAIISSQRKALALYINILIKSPSMKNICTFCQVCLKLAQRLQNRTRKYEKSMMNTNDKFSSEKLMSFNLTRRVTCNTRKGHMYEKYNAI